MQLAHIEFSQLKISKCNMRYRDPPPDISDILPSVLTKGILEPLVVRPEDGKFGIIAGRRRYFSLKAKKEKLGEVEAPPCAIMEEGDDAAAVEASLLENVARRDPDPMREYETFARLILKEGRTIDGIAHTFGMTPTQVKQRLALGNLLPKIRDAYRDEEIDDETVRHLTLASPAQQRKWLRLYSDPEQHAPTGWQLKQWLFGGQQISTSHALFKLTDYVGQIIEDLFGEDSYFADADLFWALQNRAITAKRDALLKAGWSAVEVLEVGQRFEPYEHVRIAKKKGGKVFIATSHDGEVTVHEGYLSQKEAKRLAKAQARQALGEGGAETPSVQAPLRTKAMDNYLDLHRHALARLALIARPEAAWRLAVAHMVTPSGNWRVDADPQTSRSNPIGQSVTQSPAQAAFEAERLAIEGLLGWSDEEPHDTLSVFATLMALTVTEVERVAAFFMAQSLACGSDVVEAVGGRLGIDTAQHWQADDTFLDLIRDRATLNTLVGELAGANVAAATVSEKTKTLKGIIRDCLTGGNGRTKVTGWVPGWMAFPAEPLSGPPAQPQQPTAIAAE